MQYINGLEAFSGTGRSAVTLGKFDGLHRGHQKLVERVTEYSRMDGINSIVCSFDMEPLYRRLERPYQVLMTKAERQMHLEDQVDYLVDCPFTETFSQMSAEDFIRDVLAGLFHADYVVVGTDFHFGHQKRGDIHMLAAYQDQYNYQLEVVDKERYEGREISSTFVKEALAAGKMDLVKTLLGYPYGVEGTVEHGKKLGRTLGFPTFNVEPPKEKLLPPNGVYLEQVEVDGKWYNAIGNLGVKPTVTDNGRMLIESYLLDYSDNAYGKQVKIRFKSFRRPEQKFRDVAEMKRHVEQDIACGREFFARLK